MQDFHADCTINLLLQCQGRSAKYSWVCSLVTRESVRLVLARRFLGRVSREQAEWNATVFGLRQAQRLLQEKVALCADFSVDLSDAGRSRDPGVQLLKSEAQKIWDSFRLKKMGRISPQELQVLREEEKE